MLRRPLLMLALALLLAAAFCAGVARLFALRYQSGDVYPPYSTLRTDPLGAKAIYDALGRIEGVETRRNFKQLKHVQPGRPVTLVYLGTARHSFWTEREVQDFQSLVFGGARAVFAFFPMEKEPENADERRERYRQHEEKSKRLKEQKEKDEAAGDKADEKKPEEKAKNEETGKKKKEGDEEEDRKLGIVPFDEVAKRFGFGFGFPPKGEAPPEHRRAALVEAGGKLEPEVTWHSALFFDKLSADWHPLYLSGTRPVVVERSYGRGSIVLASDSFLFSNEAQRKERQSKLLARVLGGPPLVIFDEEHLGVREEPGIVQLALRYRLHGVIAGLVLIAALFVWKNAVRFIPAYAGNDRAGAEVIGRDASQGFNNLLHRAIKPGDLLVACVAEWRRAATRKEGAAGVEEILAREQTRPARQRNPVTAYREIARAIARR